MKRTLFALLTLLALLAGAPSFAGDIHDILAKKSLRVAMMSTELPPFIYTGSDGVPAGYDVDMARGIAEELKVELKIDRSAKTFNELIDKVDSGEADMALSKLSRTLERAKRVIFSEPYLVLHKTLIVNRLDLARRRKAEPIPNYVKHLDGTMGVIRGSSYVWFAKDMFPKAKLREYPDWNGIVCDVMAGKLLCGFRDDLEVKRSMKSIPSASIELMSIVLRDAEDSIAIAVGADKMQFRYWLNEYIEERKLKTSADALLARPIETAKPGQASGVAEGKQP